MLLLTLLWTREIPSPSSILIAVKFYSLRLLFRWELFSESFSFHERLKLPCIISLRIHNLTCSLSFSIVMLRCQPRIASSLLYDFVFSLKGSSLITLFFCSSESCVISGDWWNHLFLLTAPVIAFQKSSFWTFNKFWSTFAWSPSNLPADRSFRYFFNSWHLFGILSSTLVSYFWLISAFKVCCFQCSLLSIIVQYRYGNYFSLLYFLIYFNEFHSSSLSKFYFQRNR